MLRDVLRKLHSKFFYKLGSIERLYGKLKTHEMEEEKRYIIYRPRTIDSKNTILLETIALVVNDNVVTETKVERPVVEKEKI